MTRTQQLKEIGERIDGLMALDVAARGVSAGLYAAARKRSPEPLSLAAARALRNRVGRGRHVLIATGWHDRPDVNSQIAETDGPLGAAVLARALHDVCGAIPLVLTEERLVGPLQHILRAAGLSALLPEEAEAAAQVSAALHAASVLGFPKNIEEARAHSEHLLAAFKPKAVLAVEVGGMNANGQIFTFRGDDATQHTPKFDLLFQEAQRRRVVTIGVGDGGNEIGFGSMRKAAARRIPSTRQPAQALVPTTEVDYLVPAAVSNWGAYAIAASLCLLADRPDCLHTPAAEERLLIAASGAGLIDGITGYVEPAVDGMTREVHMGLVALMQATVESGCAALRR